MLSLKPTKGKKGEKREQLGASTEKDEKGREILLLLFLFPLLIVLGLAPIVYLWSLPLTFSFPLKTFERSLFFFMWLRALAP